MQDQPKQEIRINYSQPEYKRKIRTKDQIRLCRVDKAVIECSKSKRQRIAVGDRHCNGVVVHANGAKRTTEMGTGTAN